MFTDFVEYNDHEGETWTFWLEVVGNLNAFATLGELIDNQGEPESYTFGGEVLSEHDVDVLVKHGGQGYLPNHHKVKGLMFIPEGYDVDDLYKGGIIELFV